MNTHKATTPPQTSQLWELATTARLAKFSCSSNRQRNNNSPYNIRKLLFTFILALTSMLANAQEQEYNDGFFVALLTETKNTEGIKQIYLQDKWDMKKICKEKFKNGYILNYCNAQRRYAIFNNNSKAKEMKFFSTVNFNKKKLNKLKLKGLFVTFLH